MASDEFERLKREAMLSSSKKGDDLPAFFIPNTIFSFLGGIIAAYYLFKFVKSSLNLLKVLPLFCQLLTE